jgi:hypothetical protein
VLHLEDVVEVVRMPTIQFFREHANTFKISRCVFQNAQRYLDNGGPCSIFFLAIEMSASAVSRTSVTPDLNKLAVAELCHPSLQLL